MPKRSPNGKGMASRLLFLGLAALSLAALADPAPARQAELRGLLLQDCGACHGLTLRGGLGPPLTPDALAGKSPDFLRQTIADGRPGTPMPPWRGLLDEDDIRWLVDTLRAGEALP